MLSAPPYAGRMTSAAWLSCSMALSGHCGCGGRALAFGRESGRWYDNIATVLRGLRILWSELSNCPLRTVALLIPHAACREIYRDARLIIPISGMRVLNNAHGSDSRYETLTEQLRPWLEIT